MDGQNILVDGAISGVVRIRGEDCRAGTRWAVPEFYRVRSSSSPMYLCMLQLSLRGSRLKAILRMAAPRAAAHWLFFSTEAKDPQDKIIVLIMIHESGELVVPLSRRPCYVWARHRSARHTPRLWQCRRYYRCSLTGSWRSPKWWFTWLHCFLRPAMYIRQQGRGTTLCSNLVKQ